MTGLSEHDRRDLAKARELIAVRTGTIREFTGAKTLSGSYAAAFGRAQWELGQLTAIIERLAAEAADDARRLCEIRAVLAGFDWEHDDRQFALEAIDRIASGNEDQANEDQDDGLEPFCAECGAWIGMFQGMEGWHHFRGDPAPGGSRELYDAGHDPVVAWCQPPGRSVSPADATVLGQALADAEAHRRRRAGAYCYDCASTHAGACHDHLDDLDRADAYRDLAAELTPALPNRSEEDR